MQLQNEPPQIKKKGQIQQSKRKLSHTVKKKNLIQRLTKGTILSIKMNPKKIKYDATPK